LLCFVLFLDRSSCTFKGSLFLQFFTSLHLLLLFECFSEFFLSASFIFFHEFESASFGLLFFLFFLSGKLLNKFALTSGNQLNLFLCFSRNDLSQHFFFLFLLFNNLQVGILIASFFIVNFFVVFSVNLVVVLIFATSATSSFPNSHLFVDVNLSH